MEAMGAGAVKIVIEGIKSVLEKRAVAAEHSKVGPELVVRESTRKIA
jgi:DNA-binding LacI/PurR family transcriptional regulator